MYSSNGYIGAMLTCDLVSCRICCAQNLAMEEETFVGRAAGRVPRGRFRPRVGWVPAAGPSGAGQGRPGAAAVRSGLGGEGAGRTWSRVC